MKKYYYIFVFSWLFVGTVSFSQTFTQRYERITSNEGLSQNLVWTIHQDQEGFLWFGTKDGLNKYDGYKFSYYRYDPTNNNSLSQGHVVILHECESGLLWIGLGSGKVDILDKKTERVYHLDIQSAFKKEKSVSRIECIVESKKNDHWIRTNQGSLFHVEGSLNLSQKKNPLSDFQVSCFDSIQNFCLTNDHHTSLSVDAEGRLFLDIDKGIVGIKNDSVKCFVPYAESQPFGVDKQYSNWTSAIDTDSSFWLVFWNVLYHFDRESLDVSTYPLLIDSIQWAQGYQGSDKDSKGANSAFSISVGCGPSVLRVNTKTHSVDQIIHLPQQENDPAIRVLSFLFDSGGILWIGTPGDGIFKFNPNRERFHIMKGIEWPFYRRNAYSTFLDSKNNQHHTYEKIRRNFNERTIFKAKNGNLWIQDESGKENIPRLLHCNADGKIIKAYDSQTYPFNNMDLRIRGITEDKSGRIWLATFNTLSRFDPKTEILEHFYFTVDSIKQVDGYTHDMPGAIFIGMSCFKDSDGLFWFDSGNLGLYRFNLETFELRAFSYSSTDSLSLNHIEVISLCDDPKDPHDILWVGTEGGGLNKLDKNTGSCIRYTMHDGLPNNVINGILFDKQYDMWLSTNYGICKFNPITRVVKNYDANDGLQGNEFDRFKYFQSADGMMFFGGVSGINGFYPEQVEDNNHIPPIVLTDFRLGNRPVSVLDSNSFLKTAINSTKELALPYSENVISFEFAALDFSNSKKNQYSYKLDGFNDNWSFPSTERTATYTNLDPGEYIFHVTGCNNDGVWNIKGVSLSLIIMPPWYMTWWFYTSSVLILVGTTFTLVRRRMMRLQREHQVQEEFSRALIGSHEAERKRISGELHDSVGQNILLMKNRAHFAIQTSTDLSAAQEQLNEIASLASNALNEVREISHNLRPLHLDRLGLTQAIHMLLDQIERNSSMAINADIATIDNLLSKDQEVNIFRIVQECLNNVLKHSKASKVTVGVGFSEKSICISIQDDGVGFDFDQKQRLTKNYGMGLSGLSERAKIIGGNLTITSSVGNGTITLITVPLTKTS